MKNLSATEAARRFSDLLDAVEKRRESYVVHRRGKPIARITPVSSANGRSIRDLLVSAHADASWGSDLRALRDSLRIERRAWND